MSAARLVVFDVDGTLTCTNEVDEECYEAAIRQEWNLADISTDWGAYDHSTDNAIAAQISRERRGRDATDDELAALRHRFVGLIEADRRSRPERFRAMPGAAKMLAALRGEGWHAAIATGGWTPSARIKLEAAGLNCGHLPAAFACDARAREEIIRLAVERAHVAAGGEFARVVYVGDGPWDLRAARHLGAGFVGVGARRANLESLGARTLPDFEELAEFLTLLESVGGGSVA